jgi:hypothetical protein
MYFCARADFVLNLSLKGSTEDRTPDIMKAGLFKEKRLVQIAI